MHHFATNKSSKYTEEMRALAKKYDLDLDQPWNKEPLPGHMGRHTDAYHEWVLEQMRRASREAEEDPAKFRELYERYVKDPVRSDPSITQMNSKCPR